MTLHKATSPAIATSSQHSITTALDHALKQLDGAEKEIVLDFTSVRRVNSSDLRRLEELAHAAEAKKIRVSMRGVNITVYKALKLTKLAREFSFAN